MDLDAIEEALEAMTPEWSADFVAGAGWRLRGVLGGESAGRNFVEYTLRGDAPVTLMVETWRQFEPPEWTASQKANFEGAAVLRNSAPAMVAEIRRLQAEIERLRRFVTDHSKTCYSCEVCGHARTTRECLRCEIARLRELCGEAADEQDAAKGEGYGALSRDTYARLRAASKGELT